MRWLFGMFSGTMSVMRSISISALCFASMKPAKSSSACDSMCYWFCGVISVLIFFRLGMALLAKSRCFLRKICVRFMDCSVAFEYPWLLRLAIYE